MLCITPLYSQQKAPAPSSPLETIVEESDGSINIDIPENILPFIVKKDIKKTSSGVKVQKKGTPYKTNGFRIQVFSDGRNPNTLESRAKARGNAILSKFPKYRGQVYTYSSSPNWYTRVGNFKDRTEASNAMAELKSAFPNFASEMRIVKSQIVTVN